MNVHLDVSVVGSQAGCAGWLWGEVKGGLPRLQTLVDLEKVKRVDYLTVSVEGHELQVPSSPGPPKHVQHTCAVRNGENQLPGRARLHCPDFAMPSRCPLRLARGAIGGGGQGLLCSMQTRHCLGCCAAHSIAPSSWEGSGAPAAPDWRPSHLRAGWHSLRG